MIQVLGQHRMPVATEEDVILVRKRAQSMAKEGGFDAFATAAVTTATSELTRNVVCHGGGGEVILQDIAEGERRGLRLEFRDQGPGIADLERALRGGYSTAGSLGLGLSGSRRLVDRFQVGPNGDRGTVVTIIKWRRF